MEPKNSEENENKEQNVTNAPTGAVVSTAATSNPSVTTAVSPSSPASSVMATTGSAPLVTPSYQHHKTSLNHYQKSSYSYRPNLSPYLYAAAAAAAQGQHQAATQFHPYGTIRLPYGAQQLQTLPGAAAFQANPYQAAAAAAQQQQMFLVRTPNGMV